jgi:arylsulfatase A-like enzyme
LLGAANDVPRATVSGFMDNMRAVASGRYKLVQRSPERYQLYDLARDPRETRDVAADHPLAVRHLRAQLGLMLAGRTPRAASESSVIDVAAEQQLRALGDVGSARH